MFINNGHRLTWKKRGIFNKKFVQLYIRNNYLDPLRKLWCLWDLMLMSKFSWYKNMKTAK
jgi:hypothetical protein